MKAIVVREQGTNRLIQFGPAGQGYAPGSVPNSYTQIEDDYEAVLAEDVANQQQRQPPLAPSTLDGRVAALEKRLGIVYR